MLLFDCREGEPDRAGGAAVFEGYFDFETGEQRRTGTGIPRLRMGDERIWGFEVWWRPDPEKGGLTDDDRAALEVARRMLRGLIRDTRRQPRFSGARPPISA